MRLLRSLLSVSLVCVLLFALFSVTSYATDDASYWDYYNEGYLVPSPDFPNLEALPYGADTCVYDFKFYYDENTTGVFRLYIKRDLYDGDGVSAFNGASVVFADNGASPYPAFQILFSSPNIVYFQTFNYDNSSGDVVYWGAVQQGSGTMQRNGKTCNYGVMTGYISGPKYVKGYYTGSIGSTDPCYYGGRDFVSLFDSGIYYDAPADERNQYNATFYLRSYTKSYPTASDLSSKNIANSIDENTEELKAVVREEIAGLTSSVYDNFGYVLEYQSYTLDELISINSAINDNGEKLDDINDTLEETPNKIVEGIKGLFIPTEEEMIAIKDKWELLLSDRFGALYEAGSFISDYVENFKYQGEKNTVTFPTVSTSFSGTYFEFGGWEVQLVPDKFNPFMVTVKSIIGIVCTLAFIVMLRNKFNKIVGDNT